MKTKSVFPLLIGICFVASCAKIVVTPLRNGSTTSSKGVIYALPKTVVRAQFKLEKISRQGAPFAIYAPIFAPDGDRVCAEHECLAEGTVTYRLQKGVALSAYGEPDPDNVYLVEFSNGGMVDQSLSMTWNDAGLLTASSASSTNRTTDVVMSGLKLVTGVHAKGAFGAAIPSVLPKDCGDRQSARDTLFVDVLTRNGGDLAKALIGRFCDLKHPERDRIRLDEKLLTAATQQYVEKAGALLIARHDVLIAAQSFQAAEHVAALDAEISKVITELFLGTSSTKSWEGTLDSRWIAKSQSSAELLRIDPTSGFCIPSTVELPPDAKPFPKGLEPGSGKACNSASAIYLKWDYRPAQHEQLFSRIQDDMKGDRSFRYIVPGRARFTVTDDLCATGTSFGAADLAIAQLGTVVSLPAKRTSKQINYDLAFVEATGALRTFKLGTTGGLDAATVDSLAAATGTVLDAENARKLKRATEQDELTILTREATLLELRDKICTLRQKYGQACDDQE